MQVRGKSLDIFSILDVILKQTWIFAQNETISVYQIFFPFFAFVFFQILFLTSMHFTLQAWVR